MTLGQAFVAAVMAAHDIDPADKGSTTAVAEICGVHYNAAYKWRRGISSPPMPRMLTMCQTIGIGLDEVLRTAADGVA